MAGGGIRIPFVADVRDFLAGTRKISADLEGMQSDLAETARDSGLSAERVEQDWENAGREAAAAFDKFARDADQAYERVERSARESARAADQNLTKGVSGAGLRGALGILAGEAFQEFTQAWGEAVRGGDPGEAIRELFSNLAIIGGAAFGPVGAVAGGVASFFSVQLFDAITGREQEAKLRSAIETLFDSASSSSELSGAEAARAFMRGFVEEGQIAEQVREGLGTETIAEAWERVGQLVDQTGLDIDTVTGAVLGQRDAVEQVQEAQANVDGQIEQTIGLQGRWFDKNRETSDEYGRQADVLSEQYGALGDLVSIGGTQIKANRTGLEIYRLQKDAIEGQKDGLQDSTGPARNTRDYINGIRVPSVGPMRDGLASGAESARLVRERLNAVDGRTISVTIKERLIRTTELQAKLGGQLAGDQTGLNP